MSYNLYDWNNALRQRDEYVEDRLKDGSPVVAVSFAEGILLLTLRTAQRKIFEVYDRLAMGALGKQSDIEALRLAAIDTAHKEGFERSPDDVAIQRLVGFSLSPAIKRVYNDQQAIPLTVRAIFAELGKTPEADHLFVLGYDGEFKTVDGVAVAAGTPYAEGQAQDAAKAEPPATLADALRVALVAWGTGRTQLAPKSKSSEDDEEYAISGGDNAINSEVSDAPRVADDPAVALREALKDGLQVEAGLLQRNTSRESKFRLVSAKDIDEALASYR